MFLTIFFCNHKITKKAVKHELELKNNVYYTREQNAQNQLTRKIL